MYSRANALSRSKRLLKISDTSQDDILNEILTIIEDYTLMLLKVDTLPTNIESFIVEIVFNRYGKLGSEGFKSETIEGISISYVDFAEMYEPLLKPFRKLRTM